MLNPIIKFGVKIVEPLSSSTSIVFGEDELAAVPSSFPPTHYIAVCVLPNWQTSYWATFLSYERVDIAFGTPTSSSGGSLLWIAIGRC